MRQLSRLLTASALALAGCGVSAQTVTINFDNSGDESGVTTNGASEFEFMGSNWSGGTVNTRGVPALYASGSFSYEVSGGPAMVVFDQPVTDVEFFFVDGGGLVQGTATAFDAGGAELASLDSNAATSFGDSANFVSFDVAAPISSIEFTGGAIDNFTYTLTDADEFVADFTQVEGQWVIADQAFRGAGEGLTFDFLEAPGLLFVAWFTHTTMPEMPADQAPMDVGAPGNRWLTAQLEVMGNTATGDLFVTRGGEFDAPPTDFQETVNVGDMTIEFTACNRATVNFMIEDPALGREFEIIPLIEQLGFTEPACEQGGGNGT